MKKFVIGLLMFCAASMAWALPTLPEVEAQTKAGNFAQAENMMAEVVAAKPGSAKAHYIYAEILAHNASFSKASTEAAKARELDPKIGFTDPDKFRSFEQTLQRELNPPARPRATTTERSTSSVAPTQVQAAPAETRSPGIPGWVWVGGLVLIGIVVWKMMSRSSAPGGSSALATAGGQGGYGAPGGFGPGGPGAAGGPGYGPGYGPGGAPVGRPGGGLLGTGLAVAGGVAGGMLLDEMLHKRGNDGGGSSNIGGFDPNGYQPGGDSAARDLADRPMDFGNGGDWDSGGSSDSGSGDSGGGSWD